VRVRRIGRPTRLEIEHLMASAAVPFVFPPVRIGGEYYGDGSMRHRAPLSPALHLGADRMLVIGVRDEQPDSGARGRRRGRWSRRSRIWRGYMLDTLSWTACIRTSSGSRARPHRRAARPGSAHGPLAELRRIQTLVIAPKEDIRDVAARYAHELPRPVRLLLRGLGANRRSGLQLVSYVLFESGFTRALIDMGYRDALEMEDALRAFLFDQPMDTLYAPPHLKFALDR